MLVVIAATGKRVSNILQRFVELKTIPRTGLKDHIEGARMTCRSLLFKAFLLGTVNLSKDRQLFIQSVTLFLMALQQIFVGLLPNAEKFIGASLAFIISRDGQSVPYQFQPLHVPSLPSLLLAGLVIIFYWVVANNPRVENRLRGKFGLISRLGSFGKKFTITI